MLGEPENNMFESYSLLSALAARTTKVNLGTLVTGVTYRNPAILAKTVTALDVISRGRAFLGIGAAWFDVEHEALGVEFPPVKERFERLEEAIQICQGMFRGEQPTIEGKHYRTKDVINHPAPIRGDIPLMIGGSGEKKTLRMMAQYAAMANFTVGTDEIEHKLDVLAGQCADQGRDIATINKTMLGILVLGTTMEEAEAKRNAFLAPRGLDWDALDDATKAMIGARLVVGDADFVGEAVQRTLAFGLDGVTFNMPADGHEPESVAFAGEVITKALG